jgi:hypothetical protein
MTHDTMYEMNERDTMLERMLKCLLALFYGGFWLVSLLGEIKLRGLVFRVIFLPLLAGCLCICGIYYLFSYVFSSAGGIPSLHSEL